MSCPSVMGATEPPASDDSCACMAAQISCCPQLRSDTPAPGPRKGTRITDDMSQTPSPCDEPGQYSPWPGGRSSPSHANLARRNTVIRRLLAAFEFPPVLAEGLGRSEQGGSGG